MCLLEYVIFKSFSLPETGCRFIVCKKMSELETPISVHNEEVKKEKQPQPSQPFTIAVSATGERELSTHESDKSSINSEVNFS